jgi:hypothetical protein
MHYVGRRLRFIGAIGFGDVVPRGRLYSSGFIETRKLVGTWAATMQPSPSVLALQSICELQV